MRWSVTVSMICRRCQKRQGSCETTTADVWSRAHVADSLLDTHCGLVLRLCFTCMILPRVWRLHGTKPINDTELSDTHHPSTNLTHRAYYHYPQAAPHKEHAWASPRPFPSPAKPPCYRADAHTSASYPSVPQIVKVAAPCNLQCVNKRIRRRAARVALTAQLRCHVAPDERRGVDGRFVGCCALAVAQAEY